MERARVHNIGTGRFQCVVTWRGGKFKGGRKCVGNEERFKALDKF